MQKINKSPGKDDFTFIPQNSEIFHKKISRITDAENVFPSCPCALHNAGLREELLS